MNMDATWMLSILWDNYDFQYMKPITDTESRNFFSTKDAYIHIQPVGIRLEDIELGDRNEVNDKYRHVFLSRFLIKDGKLHILDRRATYEGDYEKYPSVVGNVIDVMGLTVDIFKMDLFNENIVIPKPITMPSA